METRVERINPSLNVQDLSASIQYYAEELGFELYVETPTVAIAESDGHQLHLRQGRADGAPARVWIGVEDIAVLYELYGQEGSRSSRNRPITPGPTRR